MFASASSQVETASPPLQLAAPAALAYATAGDGGPARAPGITGFLRNVPVFAALSEDLLDDLAAQVSEVRVRAGEWIMREGDAAESMFIVRSGRVEVIDEGPPEMLIRILRRGDVLGELALLREGTRSASVRARRDAELLELGRGEFEALIERASSFALGLTRAMGAQLAASRMPVVAATPPRTIAVVGLGPGAPAGEVADGLTRALAEHGSVVSLGAGEIATIDRAENDVDRVVLRCDGTDTPWTELCMAEAHLVVAVIRGAPTLRSRGLTSALQGCELFVLGSSVSKRTVEDLQPREVHVIADRTGLPGALRATARRLAGRSLGVVLSGGGARALAHIGVLEELSRAGLQFDRVAGVSLGSLVAAAAASGFTPEGIYDAFKRSFVTTNPSNDFVLPAYSLIRGAKARRLLDEAFGDRRIEELPLRFFCLSCDLVSRECVVHNTGPVVDAVYPSMAIPGVFPPVLTPDGRLLVDGGVLDNLPVATMARKGEGPVVAVDVTGRMGRFKHAERPAIARLARPARRLLTGSEAEIPNVGETIVRSVTVGSNDTVTAARMHADVVITPQVEDIGLMEWKAMPRVVERGRDAARKALAADPDLAGRLSASG